MIGTGLALRPPAVVLVPPDADQLRMRVVLAQTRPLLSRAHVAAVIPAVVRVLRAVASKLPARRWQNAGRRLLRRCVLTVEGARPPPRSRHA